MKRKIMLFFLGALCFILSQPLLRLPILNYIQNDTKFLLFYSANALLIGIIIAFSAGIFEEGARFIFRSFLPTPKLGIIEPIMFGLGHGLAEALIIILPYLFKVPISSLYVAFLERFLAIILHIGLTVIIWNGFQLNKRFIYLFLAIFIHGFVNSLIPIFQLTPYWVILVESSLAIIDVCIIIYIWGSKKYYLKEKR